MTKDQINSVGEDTFDDVFADADPALEATGRAARALLAGVMPGITEVAWARQKTIGYGVGPKKMSEHFCYIGLHKAHVNLGFFYGADLDDPKGLLEGTGKALRHIKLTSPKDLERPGLKQLVKQASTHLPKLAKGKKP